MGAILLENFPFPMQGYMGNETVSGDEVLIYMGYDQKTQSKILLDNAVSKLFTSIIVHDEIYLNHGEFSDVVDVVGVDDALVLLQSDIVRVVDVRNYPCVLTEGGASKKKLAFLGVGEKAVEYISKSVKRKFSLSSTKSISQIELLVGDCLKKVDSEKWGDKIKSELNFDLANQKFRAELGVSTENSDDLSPHDVSKVMRVSSILSSLILQDELKVDAVALDSYSMPYLNKKFATYGPKVNLTIEPFERIMRMKGVPAIYELYKNKILSMRDIISLRETYSGKVFRRWYESTDYDEEEALRVILNRQPESVKSKFSRLVYPTVAGIFSPVAGTLASVVDSFIISRLVEGWNPSLFLDDVLKQSIDLKVSQSELARSREEFRNKFGNIGRNEYCPCGSNKKFKKCHGQGL